MELELSEFNFIKYKQRTTDPLVRTDQFKRFMMRIGVGESLETEIGRTIRLGLDPECRDRTVRKISRSGLSENQDLINAVSRDDFPWFSMTHCITGWLSLRHLSYWSRWIMSKLHKRKIKELESVLSVGKSLKMGFNLQSLKRLFFMLCPNRVNIAGVFSLTE